MNAMGHDIPTMIGVDHRVRQEDQQPDPRLHGHGRAGHGRHDRDGDAHSDNTIPMMTGEGPFGSVEMGGMFSVLKVRRDQNRATTRTRVGTRTLRARWPMSTPARLLSLPVLRPKVANPCLLKKSAAPTLLFRSENRLHTAATDPIHFTLTT